MCVIESNVLFIVFSFVLKIYTDWANHYLEKVKSKRRILDLPNDVTDGCILADVIEAVSKFNSFSLLQRFVISIQTFSCTAK